MERLWCFHWEALVIFKFRHCDVSFKITVIPLPDPFFRDWFIAPFFLNIKWRKCDLQKCLGGWQETLAEVENYSARPQNKGHLCVSNKRYRLHGEMLFPFQIVFNKGTFQVGQQGPAGTHGHDLRVVSSLRTTTSNWKPLLILILQK